jgi:hypothetical protein
MAAETAARLSGERHIEIVLSNSVCCDARTRKVLWHVHLGGPNATGPISYAVDGKQYIVGTGEGTIYDLALPD